MTQVGVGSGWRGRLREGHGRRELLRRLTLLLVLLGLVGGSRVGHA